METMKKPRIPTRIPPALFTATMGTGITSVVASHLSNAAPVRWLGMVLFALNAILFATLTGLYVLRLRHDRRQLARDLEHPRDALFFGAVPMGLATLVNAAAVYLPRILHHVPVIGLTTAWGIDVALAAITGLAVPYYMFARHSGKTAEVSVFWLLPLVPAEVAAASGGLLLGLLPPGYREAVWVISMVSFSLSVPIALSVLALIFQRYALHGLPPNTQAASANIAIGPLGTGSLALVELARDFNPAWFHAGPGAHAAAVLLGVVGGLFLWGYGLWWWILALMAAARLFAQNHRFDVGWWGLTFPLGVFTLAGYAIGAYYSISAFTIIAMLQSVILVATWAVVASHSLVQLSTAARRRSAAAQRSQIELAESA
ncbi:MAG: C4-dicarboxylate ABC transporter [Actinomycetota bacterium]|nr:C4-dicarboxylate ABC transporter [Actinomycetota bacterium]